MKTDFKERWKRLKTILNGWKLFKMLKTVENGLKHIRGRLIQVYLQTHHGFKLNPLQNVLS